MSKRHNPQPASADSAVTPGLECWKPKRLFPEEQLTRTIDERLQYFGNKILAHKHLS